MALASSLSPLAGAVCAEAAAGKAATIAQPINKPVRNEKLFIMITPVFRVRAAVLFYYCRPNCIVAALWQVDAGDLRVDPIAAALAVLLEDEPGIASFNQSEDDIAAFMRQPWVVTSSDASEGHPRYYGPFARKYATYVRERQVIDLRTFIAASTIRTARIFGIAGRGELRPGAFADVIAFDPAGFAPRADYAQPTLLSRGMKTVIVNGQVAIEDGAATGVAAGRALPRQPPASSCPKP